MPGWNAVLGEIQQAAADPFKIVRQKHLTKLSKVAGGRNIIAYYSGWLQKAGLADTAIGNVDKNAFMSMIHQMDRSKGLDIIIHTPGGDLCATESIVDYLKAMFGNDIRAIVPQLAMSAGTMICCSCKEIVMGKQSSLGPIDPQFGGIPAQGVLEEFERAGKEIKTDQSKAWLWQPILQKYHPSFLGECEKAVALSHEMCKEWLSENMFNNNGTKDEAKALEVTKKLSDHVSTKTHARQFNIDDCTKMGLKILALESNPALQDAVLTIHHAYMHTFGMTNAFKIVENQLDVDITFRARN
ncbi:MAG: ATP-dependent Clp protease proteolytic subunit [Elusimicrobiota bacterium]|jgi:ClpP class serine protease|nr:ATP-dependent Clp protease proteolytic subunit [Elusimicrobiota bacterium]